MAENETRTIYKNDRSGGVDSLNDRLGTNDPGLDALHEIIFGKQPRVSIEEASTLTPEQEEVLKTLLAGGVGTANGVTGNSAEAGLALDDVAALRAKLAAGAVDADGKQIDNSSNILSKIATRGSDPDASAAYFKTATQPLMDQANENIKTVGRDFAGGAGGFFGSERQAQDENVQKAFANAQSQLMAGLVREDENRALQAATGLQVGEGQELQALNIQLQGALAAGNMDQVAEIQNQQAQLQMQQLYQQLLGVQGKENIVMNEGGTNGQAGGILGSLLGKAASDRRLKYDIRPLMKLPIGIDLVSWRWKSNGKWSFGVIAQDLQEVMPEAVVQLGEWLGVNYNMVWAQVSKLWTRGE